MLWNTQSCLFLGKELISCELSEWCVWLFHTCRTRKKVPLSSPGQPATKIIICSKCITFRAELVRTFARAGVRYVDSNFSVEKLGATGVISLDMSKKSHVVRVRSPRLLEHDFLKAVCRTEISEIEGSCKVYAVKDQLENKLKAVPFQARSEEQLKHSCRWLPFEQHYFCSKACDSIAEDAFSVASQHSLASLISSEVLSCAHGADMLLDMLEKCQLVPVRIPSLFQQNVLKAVSRTEIEGICRVYGRETNWKTNWKLRPCSLASKKWGALEALLQMTPIRAALTCSKACDVIAEDAFSVASQHSQYTSNSIGLIDIKWEFPPVDVPTAKRSGRPEPRQPLD